MHFANTTEKVQKTKETFYITQDNDACYGRMALGMISNPR